MSTRTELKKKNDSKFEQSPTPPKRLELSPDSPMLEGASQFFTNIGSSPLAITESPFEEDFFNTKLLGMDFGEVDDSAFNPKGYTNPFNPTIDFEAIRAAKQSAITKTGALAAQFVGKTVLGTAGNVIGGFYGLGSAIAKGDKQQVFDNSVYNTIDDWNESWEKKNTAFVNPNSNLGFNAKTAKELTDAFSFIASAIGAEAVMQTVGNVVGGLGIATGGARLTRYLSKMNKITRMLDDPIALEKAALKLGKTVDEMAAYKATMDAFVKAPLQTARRMLTTTGYEAGLEARGSQEEFINKSKAELDFQLANDTTMSDAEKEEFRARKLAQINEDAEKVGMSTYLLNTGLLSVSNAMQFPTIFGNSYRSINKLNKLLRAGLNNIVKAGSAKNKFINTLGTLGRVLKNPTVEFLEETGQGLSGEFSQNYFETILGEETQRGVLSPTAHNIGASLYEALKETYGTEEGLHEGYIGAIVGAVGIPGFKRRGGKIRPTIHGGVAQSVREAREKQKYTEDSLRILNSMPLSDVVEYNTSNATKAAVGKQREDLAILTNDPVEYESSDNDKVFRYTMDRMSRNLEEFLGEDISEIKNLANSDIDKYRELFGKEETFSKEEALKEVDAFEKKVDTYKEAYKLVNQHYNSFLLSSTDVSNKLSEVLTYAVGNEKVWTDRRNTLVDKLAKLNSQDLTREELDTFINTSTLIGKSGIPIDRYLDSKNQVKEFTATQKQAIQDERAKIKDNLSEQYRYLLDLDTQMLEETKKQLDSQKELNETSKEQLDNINKALELKEQYTDVGRSARKRKNKVSEQELVDKINRKLKKDFKARRALAKISKPDKDITVKELALFLNKRNTIKKQMDATFGSTSTFDILVNEEGSSTDLLEEVVRVTDKLMSATNIAGHIYGFKSRPEVAYHNVMMGEFLQDLDNAKVQVDTLHHLWILEGKPTKEMELRLEELTHNVELIEEKFRKFRPQLTKEFQKEAQKEIDMLNESVSIFNKRLGVSEKAITQEKKAQAIQDSKPEPDQLDPEDVDFSGVIKSDKEEEPEGQAETQEDKAQELKGNRFVITEKFTKGSVPIRDLIENGTVKVGQTTNLTVEYRRLRPVDNVPLKKILGGKAGSYLTGLQKVESDPSTLDNIESDKDILTYVTYAPVRLDIEDFYNQFLPAPVNVYTAKAFDSDYSNLRFRQKLLKNYHIEDNNNLELEVHDINADLENFRDRTKVVNERPVTELGYDPDTIKAEDFIFTNQDGHYIDIFGTRVFTELPNSTTTGKLFFPYRGLNNKVTLLKMNTKKLGVQEKGEVDYPVVMYNQLKQYFDSQDKRQFRVKNTGIPFIDKADLEMRDFLSFFLRNRQGNTPDEVLLTNLFSLIRDSETGDVTFKLHQGGITPLSINNVEDLEQNKGLLISELQKMRFTIDSDFLLVNDKLDREAVRYYFDNKIINHPFNVDNNFDRVFDRKQPRAVIFRDPEGQAVQKPKAKPDNFNKKLAALKDSLADEKTRTGKGNYKTNLIAIDYSIQNDVLAKVTELGGATDENMTLAVNEVLDNRYGLINDLGKEYPQYLEKGRFLDTLMETITALSGRFYSANYRSSLKAQFIEDAQLEAIVNKTGKATLEEFLGKEEAETLTTSKKGFQGGDLINLLDEAYEDNPQEKSSDISMDKFISNDIMRKELTRTFVDKTNLFNQDIWNDKATNSTKATLIDMGITNINTFAKVFKAYKDKGLVPKTTKIEKFAEFLYNDKYPDTC